MRTLTTQTHSTARLPECRSLAANCMLIEAIGEGIKQIDDHSNGELLPERSTGGMFHNSDVPSDLQSDGSEY